VAACTSLVWRFAFLFLFRSSDLGLFISSLVYSFPGFVFSPESLSFPIAGLRWSLFVCGSGAFKTVFCLAMLDGSVMRGMAIAGITWLFIKYSDTLCCICIRLGAKRLNTL